MRGIEEMDWRDRLEGWRGRKGLERRRWGKRDGMSVLRVDNLGNMSRVGDVLSPPSPTVYGPLLLSPNIKGDTPTPTLTMCGDLCLLMQVAHGLPGFSRHAFIGRSNDHSTVLWRTSIQTVNMVVRRMVDRHEGQTRRPCAR